MKSMESATKARKLFCCTKQLRTNRAKEERPLIPPGRLPGFVSRTADLLQDACASDGFLGARFFSILNETGRSFFAGLY